MKAMFARTKPVDLLARISVLALAALGLHGAAHAAW
jgi:hypothetical protein